MPPLRVEPLEDRCVPTTITPKILDDGGPGSGSLRDAVLQCNDDPSKEDCTIQLLAGTYTLSIRNTGNRQENAAREGDLDITSTAHRLIIQGEGAATVVDASQLQDRVFHIVNLGTQVIFQGLVIRGGLAQDDGSAGALAGTTDARGGGIFSNGGDVTLDNVVIMSNVARGGDGGYGNPNGQEGRNAQGGGLYSTAGSLNISGSMLASNQATGGRGGDGFFSGGDGGSGHGGALYGRGTWLILTTSTISTNTVGGGNGGNGNSGRAGGFGGNGGTGQGGGLYSSGARLILTTLTVSTNTVRGGNGGKGGDGYGSTGPGGGLGGYGGTGQGGGLYSSGGMLSLTNATISTNAVRGGDGGTGGNGVGSGTNGPGGYGGTGQGGGLYSNGAMLSLTNATISMNILRGGDGGNAGGGGAYPGGDGGAGLGGGIFVSAGTSEAANGTIAFNMAEASMGGYPFGRPGPGQGGGVRNDGGAVSARNTLFGNNAATDHPDFSGAFVNAFYNLLSDGTGSGLVHGVDGNLVGTAGSPIDPRLGPLQDNGGPTLTHALLPGSPALDAGDNTDAPKWDQRGEGYSRIVNDVIDIGAFEAQGRAPSPGTALGFDVAALTFLEMSSRRDSWSWGMLWGVYD